MDDGQNGAKLIVDELSMTFLEECEIDYTEERGAQPQTLQASAAMVLSFRGIDGV